MAELLRAQGERDLEWHQKMFKGRLFGPWSDRVFSASPADTWAHFRTDGIGTCGFGGWGEEHFKWRQAGDWEIEYSTNGEQWHLAGYEFKPDEFGLIEIVFQDRDPYDGAADDTEAEAEAEAEAETDDENGDFAPSFLMSNLRFSG
jgi:hypothetical protein